MAVVNRPEVQLAMYRDRERVIVRSVQGAAAIERRDGRYRYVPLDADVLDYAPVLEHLALEGRTDAEGFVADRDWLTATIGHEWPDAPPRLWKAFDNLVVNTPDVMLTLQDGYCTGLGFLELFISMASTHGGLNQVNSATFVMSTTGRAQTLLRSEEVLSAIAPGMLEQFNATRGATSSREAPP